MKKFINVDRTDYINAINLQLGIYSPLNGFVTHEEFRSILLKKKINSVNFTIPINLFCSEFKAKNFKLGERVILKYKNENIGFISLKSKFEVKKNKFLKYIFGTSSKLHLGVSNYHRRIKNKDYSLGGKVFVYKNKLKKFFFTNNFLTLKKLRKVKRFDASFSTRNIPHVGHNLIQKKIMNKKNLTIFLILSVKNKYSPQMLINSYKALKKNRIYKKINILFIYLPTFFAGPNEAFFQAKIFENMKFKSFYVGRDHAGFKNFYGKFDSQKIFEKIKSKIKIIKFNEPMICKICDVPVINRYKNRKSCPNCKGKNLQELNGSNIKILIKRKKRDILSKMLDPFVYNFLKRNNFSLQND